MADAKPPETETPKKSLAAKLIEIRGKVAAVPKKGENNHHGYKYRRAVDVSDAVRDLLDEAGILVVTSAPVAARHEGHLTEASILFTFIDAETGVTLAVPFEAQGYDKGGDKGIWKAYTGAQKYLFTTLFLIPEEGDDPEVSGGAGVDARPAAPRIPLGRAKKIAQAAIDAGLASGEGKDFTANPILMAKLHDLGTAKIGALNVDQAEALEAWIREETQPAKSEQASLEEASA